MKKTILTIVFYFLVFQVNSQNLFKISFNTIITSYNLDDAYNECVKILGNTEAITKNDETKITGFTFKTIGGNITFGRNDSNKKFEGVIIYIQTSESDWVNDIIQAYFHSDDLAVKRNNLNGLSVVKFQDGSKKLKMIAIGKKEIWNSVEMDIN